MVLTPVRILRPEFYKDGCVLYLKFDEGSGSIATDSSPFKNNGTIYGAIWVDGKFGKALSFDGVDDYVEVPIFTLTDKVTVSAWAYLIDGQPSGDYAGIISNLNGLSNGNRLLLKASVILFQLRIGGVIYNHQVRLSDLRFSWNHYVATYDGSKVEIYLNGIRVYTGTQTGNLDSGTTKPTIGWGSVLTAYYHFKGIIDEVLIFNRALTEEEIKALYRGGRFHPFR